MKLFLSLLTPKPKRVTSIFYTFNMKLLLYFSNIIFQEYRPMDILNVALLRRIRNHIRTTCSVTDVIVHSSPNDQQLYFLNIFLINGVI